MRLFFNGLNKEDYSRCRWAPDDESVPRFYRISPYTDRQICYTPEALLYAQTAYFVAAILTQIANNIISRSRILSAGVHGIDNKWGNWSFLFEFCVALILVYIPGVQFAISTRAIAIPHFLIPAGIFSAIIFLYDESRKLFVRMGVERISGPKGTMFKYPGWVARNTFY